MLTNLGINTAPQQSPILLHPLFKKLDNHTRIQYEQSLKNPKELQSIDDFLTILETSFQSLEVLGHKEKQSNSKRCERKRQNKETKVSVSDVEAGLIKHFLKLAPKERLNFTMKNKRCIIIIAYEITT